jgi:hypothetical protein
MTSVEVLLTLKRKATLFTTHCEVGKYFELHCWRASKLNNQVTRVVTPPKRVVPSSGWPARQDIPWKTGYTLAIRRI